MVSASHTDMRKLPHISQSCVHVCVCVCVRKKKCKCLWHQQPYYPSVPILSFFSCWSQCSSISIAIIGIGQTNNNLNNYKILQSIIKSQVSPVYHLFCSVAHNRRMLVISLLFYVKDSEYAEVCINLLRVCC